MGTSLRQRLKFMWLKLLGKTKYKLLHTTQLMYGKEEVGCELVIEEVNTGMRIIKRHNGYNLPRLTSHQAKALYGLDKKKASQQTIEDMIESNKWVLRRPKSLPGEGNLIITVTGNLLDGYTATSELGVFREPNKKQLSESILNQWNLADATTIVDNQDQSQEGSECTL